MNKKQNRIGDEIGKLDPQNSSKDESKIPTRIRERLGSRGPKD